MKVPIVLSGSERLNQFRGLKISSYGLNVLYYERGFWVWVEAGLESKKVVDSAKKKHYS